MDCFCPLIPLLPHLMMTYSLRSCDCGLYYFFSCGRWSPLSLSHIRFLNVLDNGCSGSSVCKDVYTSLVYGRAFYIYIVKGESLGVQGMYLLPVSALVSSTCFGIGIVIRANSYIGVVVVIRRGA